MKKSYISRFFIIFIILLMNSLIFVFLINSYATRQDMKTLLSILIYNKEISYNFNNIVNDSFDKKYNRLDYYKLRKNIIKYYIDSLNSSKMSKYKFNKYLVASSNNNIKLCSLNNTSNIKIGKPFKFGKCNRLVKIAIIVSYSPTDPCGRPQQLGFINNLKYLFPYVFFDIECYYLHVKTKNISSKSREKQVKAALKFVEKEVKPDLVVTIDDYAFTHVGCPLSYKGYKIIATGLNYSPKYYADKYNKKNVALVLEEIHMNKIFNILYKLQLLKTFTKAYIIASEYPTVTEYELIDMFKKVCKKYDFPVEIVKFKTTKELITFLRNNDHSTNRYIYLLSIQRIFDIDKNKLINKLYTCRYISLFNTKHLEISSNTIFVRFANIMMSCGPDFFKMGKKGSLIFKDYAISGKFPYGVYHVQNFISINADRMYNKYLKNVYIELYPYINKFY